MTRILMALIVGLGLAAPALAAPREIIILRHAEKGDRDSLCSIGQERARALAKTYLGKGAAKTQFLPGEAPAAMLAITPHTVETLEPSAKSWGLKVKAYAIPAGLGGADRYLALDLATQQAARDVLVGAAYEGRVVVMSWEHKRIANKRDAESDLVNLLGLANADFSQSETPPAKWPGANYDYFWIVDFQNGRPAAFHRLKQSFAPPFDDLPSNDWNEPLALPAGSHCKGESLADD